MEQVIGERHLPNGSKAAAQAGQRPALDDPDECRGVADRREHRADIVPEIDRGADRHGVRDALQFECPDEREGESNGRGDQRDASIR